MSNHVARARALLRRVRLQGFLDEHGRPTDAAWKRLEEGTLSTGERTMVAVAFMLVDYNGPADRMKLAHLSILDGGNLRAVGEALIALAGAGVRAARRDGWR